MLKVSDAFNSAFAAPDRELRARVTIGKTVYDSDDLTSINYDSGAMTGEQFSIGSTYMNSAKIIFSHLVEGLKQLDEVLVEFGVLKPDGTVEYVKMGTFIVDDKIQMDRNNNTTTIECMDRMTMLGGTYVSKLTYPARIKDVAIEIANMAGVKANETSFARLSENKINQPTGYTYRDAIGLIAQFQMGFALFDRDGLLDIRTLQDNSFKIDPNQYFLKGLVKNETFFKLNGISCTVVTTSKDENGNETSKTTVLQSGSSSGAQIKLANNVMTQDVLDRMYEALKFTNYYPFSLNWNGNPAVEAGDWLTVEDLQGNEFKVPNMSYTLTYNGGLTTTSKADTSVSSPATYSYGGSMSNIVNEIGGREGAEGNHIYEGTEDQKPLFPKEGDLWYKHVGPDTEERIYKDGKWEFLTSTKTANDAADAADKASKEAEEAKKTANESVAAANDAVAKAGFANDTAEEAKSDAATAQKDATGALSDAQNALTNSSSAQADSAQARKDSAAAAADAVTAKNDAATALTDAKKALTDSGSAQADSAQARKDSATAKIQAANAATQANQAVTDASTAKADAAAAKGQATNALGQANTAIGNALTALNKVNDMSVGGRNYIISSKLVSYAPYNTKPIATNDGKTITTTYVSTTVTYLTIGISGFKPIGQYTMSGKMTINGTPVTSATFNGKVASTYNAPYTATDTRKIDDNGNFVFTETYQGRDSWLMHTPITGIKAGDVVVIEGLKFETGNVATDWSAAPEDVQIQIDNVNGELSQKVSQTTYNTLAGTVDTVSTIAKQNQSTIGTLETKTSVDTVNKTATTAQTLAQQNANELLNKASTNTVDTLTQRVTTAESTLSQTATKAELALTKTDVDKLNDTVKSQGVTLDATATKAELQVAQTNVDNLKKTVTSNTAGMTANANALKLKADSSTVSSLDGRVTNLSGQLDVQADKIAATVTANDVTGMLNGYATQTWTQSQIKTTADSINLSVTKVQNNLDNIAIGARNYIKYSNVPIHITGVPHTESNGIFVTNWYVWIPSLIGTADGDWVVSFNIVGLEGHNPESVTVSFADPKSTSNNRVMGDFPVVDGHVIAKVNLDSVNSDWTSVLIYSNSGGWVGSQNKKADISFYQIEKGNIAGDWKQAPEDMATVEKLSELQVTVNGIQGTVQNKADQSQVTQLANQISLKADTTVLNELKGTVDKQGSEITLNTNSIKLKADQSSVDTLKGTVDKQGSAIDVNTKAIALKASQSTVDTLTGRVSTAEGKITVQADQISQTVSKTELTSKLNGYATQTWTQSQIKSTADSINLNVSKVQTNLDNLKIGGTNLIQNSGFENGEAKDFERIKVSASYPTPFGEYMARIYFVNGTAGTDFTKYWTLPAPITIEANTEYTMSYYYSAAGSAVGQASDFAYNGDAVIMGLMMAHESHDNSGGQGVWKRFVRTFKLANETTITRLRIGFVTNSGNAGWKVVDNFQLEKGNKVSDHSPSPSNYASDVEFSNLEVKVNGIQTTVANKADQSQVTQLAGQITSVVGDVSANSSQITQMKADINLRVKAGDVINQINISPEEILIDGKKVHITGQTTIDNAVIKDAMIANVKADKITAGTLNAANVNVINLNANNITTGTLKGANLSMNLNTGQVLFQKGSIKSTNGNLNIRIDDGSMALTNSRGEGAYFIDGKIAMTKNDIWTNGAIHYGQLTFGNNIFGNALGSVSGVLLEGAGGVIVGNKEFNPLTLFGPGKTYPSGGGIAANNSFATVASNGWASIEGGTSYAVPFSTNNPSIVAGISGKYSAPGAWMPTSDKGAASFVKGKLVGLYAEDGGFSMDHGTTADLAAAVDGRSGYILSAATYARTYASGAQMMVTENGVFGRISSASKYKLAIGEISTLNDEAHQFLSVKPKQWFDKSESEALADIMTTGNTDYVDDVKVLPHNGFIAEDLYTAGLDSYVIRGNDGSIESIQYDRLPVLHHELIRELFNRLDAAEMEIYKLKQEVLNNAS